MPKNLSKLYGIPSSEERGLEQHEELVEKLRNNEVFSFSFQNRGYLALERTRGGVFINTLYNSKSRARQTNVNTIKETKI